MYRLAAVYAQPEDPDAFLEHYRNVHVPLAQSMPDVRSVQWGRCYDPQGGTPDAFVMTTMDWDSKEAALAALGSPKGAEANADLANFAQAGVSIFAVELED